jgi:hypothetical protein
MKLLLFTSSLTQADLNPRDSAAESKKRETISTDSEYLDRVYKVLGNYGIKKSSVVKIQGYAPAVAINGYSYGSVTSGYTYGQVYNQYYAAQCSGLSACPKSIVKKFAVKTDSVSCQIWITDYSIYNAETTKLEVSEVETNLKCCALNKSNLSNGILPCPSDG